MVTIANLFTSTQSLHFSLLRGTLKLGVISFLILGLLLISACGDDAFKGDGFSDTDTVDTGTGTTVSLGSGTESANHVSGTLSAGVATLSAGGTTTITAVLFEYTDSDGNGLLYTQAATINFTSTCVALETATIDASITTSSGVAVANYSAQGCSGNDIIQASTSINGSPLTATVTLTVAPATVGSVKFVSADPTVIALKGTGGSELGETSTLIFKVTDETGGPVVGEDVSFTLSTTVGGLSITPTTATTGANGTVQTVVQSGTVATSVRVTATVVDSGISTQSDRLAVSTGIPDQNSFEIALEALNPNVWNYDGVEVAVTAFVADHFNNPAPDGTAVSFQTEGGFIDGSCVTVKGRCSVTWVSTIPRPANARSTILASVIGEEGFVDANGNGRFDDGEAFTDLPEAFRDDNEDGVRDAGEEFLDYDIDLSYDAADTEYNGILCSDDSTICSATQPLLHVRDQATLVMASDDQIVTIYDISPVDAGASIATITLVNGGVGYTSVPTVTITDAGGAGAGATATATIANGAVNSITLGAAGAGYVSPRISIAGGGGFGASAMAYAPISEITLGDSAVVTLRVHVQDARGQVPPVGTDISATVDTGKLLGQSSITNFGSTSYPGPVELDFALIADGDTDPGYFTVNYSIPANEVAGDTDVSVGIPIEIVDVTPPTIVTVDPAAGTIDFDVASAIKVTFSEIMDSTTIGTNLDTFTLATGGVDVPEAFVTYNPQTLEAIFVPGADLNPDTVYTATVTTGVKDANGNALAAPFSWVFRTAP